MRHQKALQKIETHQGSGQKVSYVSVLEKEVADNWLAFAKMNKAQRAQNAKRLGIPYSPNVYEGQHPKGHPADYTEPVSFAQFVQWHKDNGRKQDLDTWIKIIKEGQRVLHFDGKPEVLTADNIDDEIAKLKKPKPAPKAQKKDKDDQAQTTEQ
jgi:hypothetical protein